MQTLLCPAGTCPITPESAPSAEEVLALAGKENYLKGPGPFFKEQTKSMI